MGVVRCVGGGGGIASGPLSLKVQTPQDRSVRRSETGESRNRVCGCADPVYFCSMKRHELVDLDPGPIPAVEAYKPGIDRTLLRENLKLTPTQRVEKMIAALRLAEELRNSRPRRPIK